MFGNDIRFSILVPVYNAERYLSECIESALNQTYKNFEVVLVDDGSTDTSGAICDQYAANYKNVSAYHTENGGELRARGYAIQKAQGDFFVCLDSDDRLRRDALETIAKAINKYQCDCVIYWFSKFDDEKIIPMPGNDTEEVLTDKRDIYLKCLDGQYNSMCMKAVKTVVYRKMLFYTDIPRISVGGDLIQSLTVFKNCERIAFIKDALYEYRDNTNSISYTVTSEAYRKSMCVNEMVYQFVMEQQVFNKQDYDEFRLICMEKHVDELLRICRLKATTAEKVQLLQELRNTDYFCNFVNLGQTKQLPYRHRVLFLLSRWRIYFGILLLVRIYTKWLQQRK